jgi:ligand-binding sensor domain-containing protein
LVKKPFTPVGLFYLFSPYHMRNIGRFLVLSLTLLGSLHAQGEEDHFTTYDGLPSDKVYMITTDYKGFLWCATDKGIAMYNGKVFTSFTTHDGLPLNDLWRLVPTPDGKVWYFGRGKELGYIENGQVKKFPAEDGEMMNPVNFFVEDNQVGFFRQYDGFRLVDKKWRKKSLDESVIRQIKNYQKLGYMAYANPFHNITILFNGKEWIHCDNQLRIVNRVQVNNNEWQVTHWSQIFFHENEMVYLGTPQKLYAYNYKSHVFTPIDWNGAIAENSGIVPLNFFVRDHQVGVTGINGMYYIKNNRLEASALPNHYLKGKMLISFARDLTGNIWVNTRNEGVFRIPLAASTPRLFENKNVQKIAVLNNTLYAAVEGEGVYQWNKGGEPQLCYAGHTYCYQLQPVKNTYMSVLTGGSMLIMDNRCNLHHSDVSVDSIAYYGGKASFFSGDTVYVAGASGIVIGNAKQNRKLGFVTCQGVYAITGYKNQIYLGTTSGLKTLQKNKLSETGLLNQVSIKALEVWNRLLVIGTDGQGVYYYTGNLVRKFNRFQDLVIQDFFVDQRNRLWIATNLGVHGIEYDTENNSTHTYSILKSQGIISNTVNDLVVRGDTLYCATDKGLCYLNMRNIDYIYQPHIILKTIQVNDSLYPVTHDSISILHTGSNRISLGYDIGFLSEHEQLTTYYRIEPLSDEWTKLNATYINLNNLQPGEYRIFLKVEGFNNNIDVQEFVLIIRPRWYEKRPVIFFMFLGCLLLLGLIVFYIVNRMKKSYQRRYDLQKRMVDIELEALRSKLNPHFIFNTLNSIQYFLTHNDLEQSEKYLLLFSNHIRHVFDYSHVKNLPLDKEIQLIEDYLQIEMMRFDGKIVYHIQVDPRIDLTRSVIPSMILQPYVENALKHGLLPKPGDGVLNIEFRYITDDAYQVWIADNGKGINLVDYHRKSSTGLIDDRIHLLNQNGEWEIMKEVGNLFSIENARGTFVQLTFKFKKQ